MSISGNDKNLLKNETDAEASTDAVYTMKKTDKYITDMTETFLKLAADIPYFKRQNIEETAAEISVSSYILKFISAEF